MKHFMHVLQELDLNRVQQLTVICLVGVETLHRRSANSKGSSEQYMISDIWRWFVIS